LTFPQAVKVSSSTITYAKTTTQTVVGKNVKGVKIYFSQENPNYVIYPEYSQSNKYFTIVVFDYTTTNLVGGYDIITRQYSRYFNTNECSTKESSGNGDNYVPIAYINHNGMDYVAAITTGTESSGKCTGVYSRYFIIKSNYAIDPNPGAFTSNLSSSTLLGSGESSVFYNPNNIILMLLGLPSFSGYTKCVELTFQYISANPRTLALVFYEDT